MDVNGDVDTVAKNKGQKENMKNVTTQTQRILTSCDQQHKKIVDKLGAKLILHGISRPTNQNIGEKRPRI